MKSIMERIAEAEASADAILDEANRTARERVANARIEADEAVVSADEAERASTAQALLKAQADGEAIAAEVTQKAAAETEALIRNAKEHVPEAVAYLTERIEATV